MINIKKSIFYFLFTLTTLCFISKMGIAANPYDTSNISNAFTTKIKSYNPKVLVQLGGFAMSQGEAQNINIDGAIGNYFSVNQHTNLNGLVGVGYYLDGHKFNLFSLTYGVNAFYLAKTGVSGKVFQERTFENLGYYFTTTQYPIYIAAKALIKNKYSEKYNITLDAGIGPNIIKTSSLSEMSLDNITLPDKSFSGKTTAEFTAMVGFGVKLNNVFGQVPLECGYRFFYLGRGRFNKLTNQLIDNLNTGTGYANSLLCAVSI